MTKSNHSGFQGAMLPLCQPVSLGPRDDIPAEESTVGQLKFKAGATAQ